MTIKQSRFFKILAVIIAFSVPSLMASEASARTCKSYYNAGQGDYKSSKASARRSARRAWRKKVRGLHGLKWQSWTISKNRHYDFCVQNSRNLWICKALARACKPL